MKENQINEKPEDISKDSSNPEVIADQPVVAQVTKTTTRKRT